MVTHFLTVWWGTHNLQWNHLSWKRSRHFVLLQEVETLLSSTDSKTVAIVQLASIFPTFGPAGWMNSWRCPWRFPRPLPSLPEKEGWSGLQQKLLPGLFFVVLCLFGFTSVFFLPRLFLHILTVFALGVLIPCCFEGTNVFHGKCHVKCTN